MNKAKLGGQGNSNATSVIGDKNTYQASFTPNLNAINDSDPYVSLDAGLSGFGIYDKLNLNTTFVETFDHEFYPTNAAASSQSSGVKQVVFQFSLPNWTRVSDIYLSIPIKLKYLTGGLGPRGGSALVSWCDPNWAVNSSELRAITEIDREGPLIEGSGPTHPMTRRFEDMLWPDWALLHIFQSIQIFMGNNSQPVGRTSASYLPGLKVNANDNKYDDDRISEAGLWGVPTSNMTCSGHYIGIKKKGEAAKCAFPVNADEGTSYNMKSLWAETYKSVLMTTSPLAGGQLLTAPTWTKPPECPWLDNKFKGGQSESQIINLPLPLWLVNPFFKGDKMLPPDTKFKIDLYFEPGTQIVAAAKDCAYIYDNSALSADQYNKPSNIIFGVEPVLSQSTPKLVMRCHTIKQDLQLAINTRWQTYPLLYNYETYEPYELFTSSESSPYIKTIAISQQRPTEIFIRIVDTTTNFPAQSSDTLETLYADSYRDSLASAVIPGQASFIPSTGTGLNNSIYIAPKEWAIADIKIKFQGRLVYWWRNLNKEAENIPTEYDRLNAMYKKMSYQKYGNGVALEDPTFGITNCRLGGTQLSFVIAPGGRVDNSNLPADQGAQHIIVEVTTTENIPAGKKIQFWKKLPEQISVDINKNVNIIMWPAIKSNENVLLASTVNTQ